MNAKRFLTLPAILLFLAAPLAASADDIPSYARPVQADRQNQDETITGTISSIDGTYNISVRDDRGFLDNVTLQDGTIINPTGLTLAQGMTVTITGHNAGSTFDAIQIDTPYTYDGPPPTPVYYGAGVWYPGYAYGYGPSFSLFISSGYVLVRQPWVGHWYAGPWGGYYHGGSVAYHNGYGSNWNRYPNGSPRYGSNYNGSSHAPNSGYNGSRPYAPVTQPGGGYRGSAPNAPNTSYRGSYGGGSHSAPSSYHSAPSGGGFHGGGGGSHHR